MKSETNLKLGDLVRDRVTGFAGIVMCRTDWLNGCIRIGVQPRELKDGKPIDALTFDVEQLLLVESGACSLGQRATGGPMPDAVGRRIEVQR